jgi:hypothetical protein
MQKKKKPKTLLKLNNKKITHNPSYMGGHREDEAIVQDWLWAKHMR